MPFAGAVTGIVMNQAKAPEALVLLAGFPGKLFLNTLKMLVLPLLSFSIMSGVGSLSKNKKKYVGVINHAHTRNSVAVALQD